ncbi:unnamed protein product [Sphenostylis stenocarpa]|uniref:Uncharacterized protein n=1 Tax=Sphenostylis stenocarpa TaxID=92480 RepID=A0AA86SMF1_9FABA|nr:unnamed protein product [Sphenostylis stenocarpa]
MSRKEATDRTEALLQRHSLLAGHRDKRKLIIEQQINAMFVASSGVKEESAKVVKQRTENT